MDFDDLEKLILDERNGVKPEPERSKYYDSDLDEDLLLSYPNECMKVGVSGSVMLHSGLTSDECYAHFTTIERLRELVRQADMLGL